MILEIRDLKKHFTVGEGKLLRAVDGVSLAVKENEIVGLVGESGCGKSTLGRTIVGLYDKTDGSVYYKGEKLPTSFKAEDFRRFSREIRRRLARVRGCRRWSRLTLRSRASDLQSPRPQRSFGRP